MPFGHRYWVVILRLKQLNLEQRAVTAVTVVLVAVLAVRVAVVVVAEVVQIAAHRYL